MSYITECYLDYLDNKILYEGMFVGAAYNLIEAPSAALLALAKMTKGEVGKKLAANNDLIAKLVKHKETWTGRGGDMAQQVIPKIDAKIQAAQKAGENIQKIYDTAKPGAVDLAQQRAKDAGEYVQQKAGEAGTWAQQKAAQAGEKFKTADAWAKEKIASTDTGQAAMKGLEKVGGKVAQKTTQPLPSGVAGPPQQVVTQPGTGVAGGVETGLQKVGVSPDTAAQVGTQAGGVAQTVASSPLGMAALGGAAAFGGYKLYKRFLSKGARACRGYSGGQKTACMKSYMDAKKGQVSTRGVDAVGQGAVAGAS